MYLSENIIGQLNKKIGLGLNNLNLINIDGMIFSDKGEIISSGPKEQYNDEQLVEGVNSSTEEIKDQSVAQTQIYNDTEAVDEKNKNKTDPHVIFDNNLPKNIIVTSLQHAYNDSDSVGTGQYTQEYEETRIDGIQFPLIQVDTMVFNEARVEKMVLNYREMVPSIYLEVDNSDLSLMPGMTAFVTIVVNRAEDVWKAQNSAFLLKSFANIDPAAANVSTANHLAVLRDKKVVIIDYEKGLVTATETEIISNDVKSGDRIIVGRVGQESTTKKSTMRGGPMGGGPR